MSKFIDMDMDVVPTRRKEEYTGIVEAMRSGPTRVREVRGERVDDLTILQLHTYLLCACVRACVRVFVRDMNKKRGDPTHPFC